MCARCAPFVLTVLILIPDLPSPRGAPPTRPRWTTNFPYKAHCTRRNGEFQHQCVLLMYWLINNLFPTSVGINTFITVMLQAVMVERLQNKAHTSALSSLSSCMAAKLLLSVQT